MKKTILLSFLMLGLFLTSSFALTHRVIVGAGGGRSFTPQNITTASVGDTVRWVWESGIHNTVSTTIPAGASSWNAPIDESDTVYSYVITVPGTYDYVCTFHAGMGMTGSFTASTTGIRNLAETAQTFSLSQNYPNPFNPVTSIRFSLPEISNVRLSVFDISGREVKNLLNGKLNAGTYEYNFNAEGISSGVYFYRIDAGKYSEIKRMVLLK